MNAMFQEQCNSEPTAERIRGERNFSRMHSAMDSGASKFVAFGNAMTFGFFTQMNEQQNKSGVWKCRGCSVGPLNPGSLRCQSGTDEI